MEDDLSGDSDEGSDDAGSDTQSLQLSDSGWQLSDSPAEDFGDAEGANSDGEWPLEIVGEEVNYYGEIRYQVKWDNWHRADGTSTTWETRDVNKAMVREWNYKQTVRRRKLAAESDDIEIWTTTDIHNTKTRLRDQAYDEKLKNVKSRGTDPFSHLHAKMARLVAEKKAMDEAVERSNDGPSSSSMVRSSIKRSNNELPLARSTSTIPSKVRSASITSATTLSSTSRLTPASSFTSISSRSTSIPSTSIDNISSSRLRKRSRSITSVSSSQESIRDTRSQPTRLSKGKSPRSNDIPSIKGKETARDMLPPSSALQHPNTPRPIRPLPTKSLQTPSRDTRRERLQREWTEVARSHHAARITITNTVDNEAIPPIPGAFRYMETGPYNDPDNIMPQISDDFFLRCECEECSDAATCDCQLNSEILDEHGSPMYAYSEDGLLVDIPPGREVIECNRFCRCDVSVCQNRVSQRPRDFGVDIFKTTNRGWGVRPVVDIPKGKVLGIYIGNILRREDALALPEEFKAYYFDLDGHEDPDGDDGDDDEKLYTVDSRLCGNWSRFINHSCSPNLRIYMVVYDTLPEMKIPYLAFVATENIKAYTEFTVDYNPAAEVPVSGKGKQKLKVPEGAKLCRCGSNTCRGLQTFEWD